MFQKGDRVYHAKHGMGEVKYSDEQTAAVRFEHGLEECQLTTLERRRGVADILAGQHGAEPAEVLTKAQAAAIHSLNDTWGIFSRSSIVLLPHQLWVCHQVLRQWPARYLIADDVGLGKSVEAGLILWPLLTKQQVRRLLILCPASLVAQWQMRLRELFDIRLTIYRPDDDTAQSDYWEQESIQVVASLATLRMDRNQRHQRLLESKPWDLLIVDEAHHLYVNERGEKTLGYSLVEKLVEMKRVASMLFFSGTPHRGQAYGFWALLKLLRPDYFDPHRPDVDQIGYLRQVVIRNNKNHVTDMQGNPLFQPVTVYAETFSYSAEEAEFYQLMTEFIRRGHTYASTLDGRVGNQVMLVIIALQKIASSSIAAIRSAIHQRLERLGKVRETVQKQLEDWEIETFNSALEEGLEDDEGELDDRQQWLDPQRAQSNLTLMEQEIPYLQQLAEQVDAISVDSKIATIIHLINDRFADRSILFFTEYKATQAALMSALMAHYGEDSVTFINGDERLESISLPNGGITQRRIRRSEAAERFNEGKVRFLISTEAGGEGIDLQRQCHTLIHVDMPWNPMRMHQRVGRLNRHGQKRAVEVVTVRNPDTLESYIWHKLDRKLNSIMQMLGSAMDDPEDLRQLVLGMTTPKVFTQLYSEGEGVPREKLDHWFDQKTATLGGVEIITAVKNLLGEAKHFDLHGLKDIPKLDLPDLQPFFERMLRLNNRQIKREGETIGFHTPDAWLEDDPGLLRSYPKLCFDRSVRGKHAAEQVVGVGHKAFDKALKQAMNADAIHAEIAGLEQPLFLYQLYDRVTDSARSMRQMVAAVEVQEEKPFSAWPVLSAAELLQRLNDLLGKRSKRSLAKAISPLKMSQWIQESESRMRQVLPALNLPFKVAEVRFYLLLLPKGL